MAHRDIPIAFGETLFYAFTLALAAGPLDRAIEVHLLPAVLRAAAWGLVYAGFALLLLLRPRQVLAGYAQVWPLLLMPAYALLSVLWSVRPGQSAVSALQLTAAVLFGAAMGARMDERRLLAMVMTVLGTLAACNLAFILLSPEALDINGEAIGLFSHKNANGGIMATAALAAIATLTFGGRRWRALAVAMVALPALALSGSRTAWVAAAAGIAVIEMLRLRRLGRPARAVMAMVALAGVCAAALLWLGSGLDAVTLFLKATGKDPTLTGRTELWDLAWNYIGRAPWLGHGFDAFWTTEPTSDAAFVNGAIREHLSSFHNGLLEAAVDLGWIGTALQLALMAAFLLPLGRLLRRGDAAAAAFAAALLVQVAVTNLAEVALFIRHGFHLLLLAALWSRSGLTAPEGHPTKAEREARLAR